MPLPSMVKMASKMPVGKGGEFSEELTPLLRKNHVVLNADSPYDYMHLSLCFTVAFPTSICPETPTTRIGESGWNMHLIEKF